MDKNYRTRYFLVALNSISMLFPIEPKNTPRIDQRQIQDPEKRDPEYHIARVLTRLLVDEKFSSYFSRLRVNVLRKNSIKYNQQLQELLEKEVGPGWRYLAQTFAIPQLQSPEFIELINSRIIPKGSTVFSDVDGVLNNSPFDTMQQSVEMQIRTLVYLSPEEKKALKTFRNAGQVPSSVLQQVVLKIHEIDKEIDPQLITSEIENILYGDSTQNLDLFVQFLVNQMVRKVDIFSARVLLMTQPKSPALQTLAKHYKSQQFLTMFPWVTRHGMRGFRYKIKESFIRTISKMDKEIEVPQVVTHFGLHKIFPGFSEKTQTRYNNFVRRISEAVVNPDTKQLQPVVVIGSSLGDRKKFLEAVKVVALMLNEANIDWRSDPPQPTLFTYIGTGHLII